MRTCTILSRNSRSGVSKPYQTTPGLGCAAAMTNTIDVSGPCGMARMPELAQSSAADRGSVRGAASTPGRWRGGCPRWCASHSRRRRRTGSARGRACRGRSPRAMRARVRCRWRARSGARRAIRSRRAGGCAPRRPPAAGRSTRSRPTDSSPGPSAPHRRSSGAGLPRARRPRPLPRAAGPRRRTPP